MEYEKKLQSLGFTLPPPPKPVATYVPAVRSGNLLFLSGMIPMVEGKMAMVGKLGKELTVEQGQEAARITLLNALAVIKAELGSLDEIKKIVRIGVHVASSEGFTQQPAVANGASDLLVQIFGEVGRHARLALGAAELPLGAPVELEMIVEVAG
ncbi:MAG: RidA family protein [Candidatus Manganitrophaceae bacterium]